MFVDNCQKILYFLLSKLKGRWLKPPWIHRNKKLSIIAKPRRLSSRKMRDAYVAFFISK